MDGGEEGGDRILEMVGGISDGVFGPGEVIVIDVAGICTLEVGEVGVVAAAGADVHAGRTDTIAKSSTITAIGKLNLFNVLLPPCLWMLLGPFLTPNRNFTGIIATNGGCWR
jgi:hypothetical protein